MARYINIEDKHTIEAWQVPYTNDPWNWFLYDIPEDVRLRIDFVFFDDSVHWSDVRHMIVNTKSGGHFATAYKGYYIVRDGQNLAIIDRYTFENKYNEVR